MRRYLGSRRRFLYRVIVYALLPFVGLFVFLAEYELLEGRLLGLIGMTVGIGAWLLLFSRIQDPKSAFRFALQPRRCLRRLVERWEPNFEPGMNTDPDLDLEVQRRALQEFLAEALPDVALGERTLTDPAGPDTDQAQGKAPVAIEVAEEFLIVLSPPPASSRDWEILKDHLEGLRTPLREEPVLLVLLGKPDASSPFRDRHLEVLVKQA
jgi:hypothetical protein